MYRSHVLVCGGTGCTSSNSMAIIEALEKELKEADKADDDEREDEIEKRLLVLEEKAEELEEILNYFNSDELDMVNVALNKLKQF